MKKYFRILKRMDAARIQEYLNYLFNTWPKLLKQMKHMTEGDSMLEPFLARYVIIDGDSQESSEVYMNWI